MMDFCVFFCRRITCSCFSSMLMACLCVYADVLVFFRLNVQVENHRQQLCPAKGALEGRQFLMLTMIN